MTKKVVIEMPYPDVKQVSVPTAYATPIMDVEHENEARIVVDLIQYLQRLPDIEYIINADHQHVRHPLCREWVRDRLLFVPNHLIWHIGESLAHLLMEYRKGAGLVFTDYTPTYTEKSNGTKWQLGKYTYTYNTEQGAVEHAIKIYLASEDFKYTVKE